MTYDTDNIRQGEQNEVDDLRQQSQNKRENADKGREKLHQHETRLLKLLDAMAASMFIPQDISLAEGRQTT